MNSLCESRPKAEASAGESGVSSGNLPEDNGHYLSEVALAGAKAAGITVRKVVEEYLELGAEDLCEATRKLRIWYYGPFLDKFGDRLVADCRPLELKRWLKTRTGWKSDWTIRQALSVIKRPFNWAVEFELIEKNPFMRVRHGRPPKRGRAMADVDFQRLLRVCDPIFRRFLIFMKFTGCRPIEASSMRWRDIHFEQGCVVLAEHKTFKKTGKPRRIPIVPPVAKLLVWMRSHRQATVIGLAERLLLAGPMPAGAFARAIDRYGVSYRGAGRARRALGVIKELVSGPPEHYVYRLPADHEALPDPVSRDFVFINCLGNPFDRRCLSMRMRRARRRAGLPLSVRLYGLRHRYGTQAIKNNVNPKLVSLCMGHESVTTTEMYFDDEALTGNLQQAALQAVFGQGAVGVQVQPSPLYIPMPTLPPIEEIQPITEHCPTRYGLERPRPAVPVPEVEAPQNGERRAEYLLQAILERVSMPAPRRAPRPAVVPSALTPAQQDAFRTWQWAIEQLPELSGAKDAKVYEWLRGQARAPGKLPATASTFGRYLSAARLFHDCRKRVLRPRCEPEPVTEEEPARRARKGGAA